MINKFKTALYALPVALASAAAIAQDSGTEIQIPAELTGISFTDLISSLAGLVAPAIVAVLGLVAGVWAIQFIWRKIRSVGR